ncbi:MAG: hypothetical protein SFU83_22250 [Meiothermus sp.]|nr:hypothetical protein [Meiothermus sp.]
MSQTHLCANHPKPSSRASLLLHLWLKPGGGLRACLEDIHSGHRSYYSRVEELGQHLHQVAQELQTTTVRKGIR